MSVPEPGSLYNRVVGDLHSRVGLRRQADDPLLQGVARLAHQKDLEEGAWTTIISIL